MRDPGGLKFHPHNVSFSTFLDGEKENSLGWIPPMWPSLKHVLGDLDSIMILHDSTWFPKTYLPSATPTFSVIYFCHFFQPSLSSPWSSPQLWWMLMGLCARVILGKFPHTTPQRGASLFSSFSLPSTLFVSEILLDFIMGLNVRNMDIWIYVILCWDLNDVTLILGKFPHSPYNSTTRGEWASRFPPDHHHHHHHCLFYLSFPYEHYSTNWCHRLDKSW